MNGPRKSRASGIEAANVLDREWQPIETAPKDGTEIDLWTADGSWGRIPDCKWRGKGEDACWYTRGDRGWDPVGGFVLTHWMPLPAPPESGK